MRRTLLAVTAGLCSALLAAPAWAEFAQPHPMSTKYRDAGAKPVGGRAGSAAIEVRALRDAANSTELEVTTGQFEGAAPRGQLAKVQVKLLTDAGVSMQTDNYRKTLTGNGYASFTYDDLRRGQLVQVQANVTGIDPNRTDVVTVSARVNLRPDIEAVSLSAPSQVRVGSPVTIHGVMAETNGDVGARATCRLLVDGAEVGAIANAWVDAAGSVACRFDTTFQAPGTRTLTLEVTDVTPGDFDAGNNSVSASIEVVDSQAFQYFQTWADDYRETNRYREERQFTRTSGEVSTWTRDWEYRNEWQTFGAYGHFSGNSSLSEGRIVLTHASGAAVLPALDVAVAALPYGWANPDGSGCRYGDYSTGFYAQVCTGWWGTDVYAYRHGQAVVYAIDRGTAGGAPWWYYTFDNGSNVVYQYGAPVLPLASTYIAELRHESPAGTHVGALEVALSTAYEYAFDNWTSPSCWSYSWYEGTEAGCWRQAYDYRRRYGYNQVSNP